MDTNINSCRGKTKDTNQWISGYIVICDDRFFIVSDEIQCYSFDWLKHDEYIFGKFTEVVPESFGQYTGLSAVWTEFENEPQESDLYSGDVLEVNYEGKQIIGLIKQEAGMFILCSNEFPDSYIPLFSLALCDGDGYYLEAKLLGNLYDNPELVKGD